MKKLIVVLMAVAISLVGLGEVFAGDNQPYAKATKVQEVKTRKGLIPGIGEFLFGTKKEKVEPPKTPEVQKLAEQSSEVRKVPCTNGVCHEKRPKPAAPAQEPPKTIVLAPPPPPKPPTHVYVPDIQLEPQYSYDPECFKPRYTYRRARLPDVDIPVYVPSYELTIYEQRVNYRREEYPVPVEIYEAPTYRSQCEEAAVYREPPRERPRQVVLSSQHCREVVPVGVNFEQQVPQFFERGGYGQNFIVQDSGCFDGYGQGYGRGFTAGRVQYHLPDPMPRR